MMKRMMSMMLLLCLLVASVSAATSDFSKQSVISVSLINQDPDPASAGDLVELRFDISNQGGVAAENVMLELIEAYPFELVSGQSALREVGTLNAYQQDDNSYVAKYQVKVDQDATEGSYELKVNYYEAGSGSVLQKSVWIDVSSRDSAEIIYIDQVELVPGCITPLTFTINNVGSAPLRDLTFRWENENDIVLPVGSDNAKYIKFIDVGESAEVSFNVIASASADPDLYKLDLDLSYDDPVTGEVNTISTKAGVYVGGETDFDVAFSDESSGEYSFTIANIGSVSATSVMVKVPEQQGWTTSGSNSVIIGNLNEGDYTIASFTLSQVRSPGASSSGDIALDIMYTDSLGGRNTVSKTVALGSSSSSTNLSYGSGFPGMSGDFPGMGQRQMASRSPLKTFWTNNKWYLIGAVVLVGFFVLRRTYRKRKFTDPDYSCRQLFHDLFHCKSKKQRK